MAIESPLYQSAMELLGHSFSHFNSSDELDRKLVILHLANSIELILKDMVLDSGESIYKSPKETITIYGCIKSLEECKVDIPYLNKIELLIDERNALQHRFGSPNELTTIFYMNIAQKFFKEILKVFYAQDYDEILAEFVEEKDLYSFKLREPNDESELENLKKLVKLHPLGALLSANSYLEKIVTEFIDNEQISKHFKGKHRFFARDYRFLERFGIDMKDDLKKSMDEARRLRNVAASGRLEPTSKEVLKSINSIEKFEEYLKGLDLEKVKSQIQLYFEEQERIKNQEQVYTEEYTIEEFMKMFSAKDKNKIEKIDIKELENDV